MSLRLGSRVTVVAWVSSPVVVAFAGASIDLTARASSPPPPRTKIMCIKQQRCLAQGAVDQHGWYAGHAQGRDGRARAGTGVLHVADASDGGTRQPRGYAGLRHLRARLGSFPSITMAD